MRTRRRVAAAVTVIGLLAASCTRSDSALDASSSSTTTERSTSTTSSSTTSTSSTSTDEPSSTTSVEPAPARCPADEPVDRPAQSVVPADVDGDGRSDRIRVWRDGSGVDHLTVGFADGGSTTAVIVTDSPSGGPQAYGAADVDAALAPEIFVGVGSGASAALVGLFVFEECALTRVTTGDEPAVLAVGGSVGSIAGAACEDVDGRPGLVVRTGTSQDGDTYVGEARSFVLEGSVLRLVDTADASTSHREPGFERFTSLRCGPVAIG